MRVIVAEDQALLREGLVRLFGDLGHEVTSALGDVTELESRIRSDDPDLVVLDIRMPPTHTDEGIRAALVIRRQWPEVAVLVLSQYVEERYATDLLAANTSSVGYLLKDRVAGLAEFTNSLARVAA